MYFEPEKQKDDNQLFDFQKTYKITLGLAVAAMHSTTPFFRVNIGWRYLSPLVAMWGCAFGACLVAIGDDNKASPLLPIYIYSYFLAYCVQWWRSRHNRVSGKHVHSFHVGDVWMCSGADNPTKVKREKWLKLGMAFVAAQFSPGITLLLVGSVIGESIALQVVEDARRTQADDIVDAQMEQEDVMARVRQRRREMGFFN